MAPLATERSGQVASRSTWRMNWQTLWRIFGLLRPHWIMSLGALGSAIMATVFALIVPWLLAWVVDDGTSSGHWGPLLLAAAAVLVVSALRGLFAYWQGYLSQALSVVVAYDLRKRVYITCSV